MDNGARSPLILGILMKSLIFPVRWLRLTGAALLAVPLSVLALEPRTWISLDGRTLDAELIRTEGEIVEL